MIMMITMMAKMMSKINIVIFTIFVQYHYHNGNDYDGDNDDDDDMMMMMMMMIIVILRTCILQLLYYY